jgi:hypothetical protein
VFLDSNLSLTSFNLYFPDSCAFLQLIILLSRILHSSDSCLKMASVNCSSSVEKTSFKDIYKRAVDLSVKQGCPIEIASKIVLKEYDEELRQFYRSSSKTSRSSPPTPPSPPGNREDSRLESANTPPAAPTTLDQQEDYQGVGRVVKNVILRFTYELFSYINKMN